MWVKKYQRGGSFSLLFTTVLYISMFLLNKITKYINTFYKYLIIFKQKVCSKQFITPNRLSFPLKYSSKNSKKSAYRDFTQYKP